MHRLIVAFLAAVDAAIAVAVGLAATLAPLTLLWVFGLGGAADWGVLWPTGVAVWQLGNLVPLDVTLPADYLAAAGIDAAAASFTLSLAPLAFAAFTAIFAARSGVRASRADAWGTGVVSGTVVFAALTAGAALTSRNDVVAPALWQAILFPILVFAVPALVAAVVTEWREAGGGVIARVRDRVEADRHGWAEVPALIARGAAVVMAGLIGVGAAVAAVAVFARAGQIVALYQAGNVDVIGAIVLTLGQLSYAPTLAAWGMAFAAGPGFLVGEGASVSPAGTHVGVIPGIPALGAIPESTTPWLLLLALAPVALGVFAGWIARSRLVGARSPQRSGGGRMPRPATAGGDGASRPGAAKTMALEGLLAGRAAPTPEADSTVTTTHDPVAPRLVIAVGIAVVSAALAALLAAASSGSLGPGRFAVVGPEPGPVALAVGAEVLLGAAILLVSPRTSGAHSSRVNLHRDAGPVTGTAPGSAGPAGLAPAAAGVDSGWTSTDPDAQTGLRHPEPSPPTDEPSIAESDARTEPIDLPRLD